MVPSPPDDLDALAAADPTALDFTLERIAVSRVDLWPVLAANPSTPETVLGVMRSYGSAQVQEILAHRQTPTAGSRSSLRQVATDSQGPLGVVEGGPLGAVGDQDDWDLSNGVRLLPPVPIYSWGSQPSQPPRRRAAGGRRARTRHPRGHKPAEAPQPEAFRAPEAPPNRFQASGPPQGQSPPPRDGGDRSCPSDGRGQSAPPWGGGPGAGRGPQGGKASRGTAPGQRGSAAPAAQRRRSGQATAQRRKAQQRKSSGSWVAVLAVIVLILGLGRGCIGMLGLDGQSTSHAPSVRPSTIPGLDVRTPSLGWLRYGTWILDPARLDPDFASGFTEAWRIPGLAPGSRVEDSEGGNLIAAELADGSVGLWDMGDGAEEGPVQIWSGPCPQGWALGARSLWCGSTQISVSEDEQGQGSQSAATDEVSTNATGRLVAQRSSWALFVEGTGSDGRPEGALSVWMVNHSTPLWSSPGPFRNVEQVNSRLLRAQDATSGETVLLEWATGQEVLRGAQDAQVLLAGSGQGVFLIEAEAGRAQFYDAAGASPSAPYEVDAGRPVHLLGSPSVFSEEEFNALVEDGAQAAARGTWNLYQGAQQVNVVLPSAGADCATWTVEGREVDITSLADGSGTCPVTLTLLDGKADDGASVILLQGPSGAQVTTASTKSNAPSSTVAGTVTALYSRLVVANQNGELVGFLPED